MFQKLVEAEEEVSPSRKMRVLGKLQHALENSTGADDATRNAWALVLAEAHIFKMSAPPRPVLADPVEAQKWWKTLNPSLQKSSMRWHTRVLGALDGVPYEVRNTANRMLLAVDEENVRFGRVENANIVGTVLATRKALNMQGRKRTLLLYQPEESGDSRVAVGCGDLGTATRVTLLVPGFRGRPNRRIETLVEDTDHVLDAADLWTRRAGDWQRGVRNAGVAWIGYKTPGWRNLPSLSPAQRGAQQLTGFAAGVAANGQPTITVVGHSYGGVVASLAAKQSGHINRIVLVGAPGAPLVADRKSADIFVVTAKDDRVAALRWFAARDDGASLPSVDLHGEGEELTHGHNTYFVENTPSVRHIGSVAAGGTPPVVRHYPRQQGYNPRQALLGLARRFAPKPNDVDIPVMIGVR